MPVAVIGKSEDIRPNDVRAVTLYPRPWGMLTRMEEKEVLSAMSRQPLAGRAAATEIPPF